MSLTTYFIIPGNFVDFVGGPSHAHCLLGPLETLCLVEESAVRDKAVESICNTVKVMSVEDSNEHFVKLLHSLATREWFTSRISACGLFAVAYEKLPSSAQITLLTLFSTLCRDDAPMVRRAAAKNICSFVEVVNVR